MILSRKWPLRAGWISAATLLATSGLLAMGTAPLQRPDRHPDILLVIPARYTLVQLAFDLHKLRPITLAAYDNAAPHSTPVLHVWDPDQDDWILTEEPRIRSVLAHRDFAESVVIGADAAWKETLDAIFREVAPKLRLSDSSPAQVVNAVNQTQSFRPREWRWLAERHDLEIKDLQEERRRYGRFGRPGDSPRGRTSPPTEPTLESLEKNEHLPPPIEMEWPPEKATRQDIERRRSPDPESRPAPSEAAPDIPADGK